MLDPRAELISEYHAAKNAGNNKAALDILMRIGKIDAQQKPVEPVTPPENFPTRRAAREYLDECGWSGVYSTFCLHVEQRKILPCSDGSFTRDDLDAYAVRELIHHGKNANPNNLDEIHIELKREELLKAQRKRAQEEGVLINSEEIKRSLENMFTTFRAQLLLLPRVMSAELSQIDSASQIETLLNKKIRDILTTMSQFAIIPEETTENE